MEINNRIFFNKMHQCIVQQNQQKQRGLNDYNMVNIVRRENQEVGMHSNVIYSLLDTNGLHYQKDLFLKLFIKEVLGINIFDFGEIISVESEESTNENRRIDFTIKSTNYYIGIEMKIDAVDLKEQIFHYCNYLKEEAKKDKNQKVIIYYLTKYCKDAPDYSKCREKDNKYIECIDIKKISFKNQILKWINLSQNEVRNITNLNIVLEDYKNIVKKITNQYKGNIVPITDSLEKEDFETAYEIYKSLPVTLSKMEEEFWKEVVTELDNQKIEYIEPKITYNDISNARSSTGVSGEINLQFELYSYDNDKSKVMMQIGAANYADGIYLTVYKDMIKGSERKWVGEKKDRESFVVDILKQIDEEEGYKFRYPSWAYGSTIFYKNIELRKKDLFIAQKEIEPLVKKIQKFISDFKEHLKEHLKK